MNPQELAVWCNGLFVGIILGMIFTTIGIALATI